MEIKIKHPREMTQTEYRACYFANYRDWGLMQTEIYQIRHPQWYPDDPVLNGTAIMIWDGPEDDIKSLLAWALVTPTRTWGTLAVSDYAKRKSPHTAEFWVKKQHRRKGYGKILMEEVLKIEPHPFCFPHSPQSAGFFAGRNYTTSREMRNEWGKVARKPAMV